MKTRLLDLTEEEDRLLLEYAKAHDQSWHAVLRAAVREYLQARGVELPVYVREPQRTMSDEEWQRRMEALEERVQARIPRDMTPEEIEAEITAASEEVRRERLAERERERRSA